MRTCLIVSAWFLLLHSVAVAQGPPPEHGHGLTDREAADGWLSLFDGRDTFGWTGAKVVNGRLTGGPSTSAFPTCEVRAEVERGGMLEVGGRAVTVREGSWTIPSSAERGTIRLGEGVSLRSLCVRPLGLKTIFDAKSLDGCKRVDHPTKRPAPKVEWTLENGWLHAKGGPGAFELPGKYDDFLLQVVAETRATHANGGVFFRNPPGSFMMGYEAQVYNSGEQGDPARPSRYATGAIDDRQNARRLVSRDGRPFLLTVLADGPHIATWVNGHQVTDWTDTRPRNETPRQGLRTEAGTIQLQAHDPETDIGFGAIRIIALH